MVKWPDWGWRRSAIRAALVLSAYALITAELLSLVQGIHRLGLSIIWILPALLGIIVTFRHRHALKWPAIAGNFAWSELVLLSGIGVILITTAVVAWRSPPQTWDSLNYHMPRVAQWTQNRSLQHFATGIEVQNSRTPAAEILMLNVYVLTQADSLVTFVQWSAMIGSLIGVSLIASQLGANRPGQLFAVLFAATLPMGIVQASSTINDYVVAIFAIAAASEALNLRLVEGRVASIFMFGLAGALAIATKPTAISYILPFAVYVAYLLLKMDGWSKLVVAAAIGAMLAVVINAGHLVRNYGTYGSFLNPTQVRIHSNELRTPGGIISNLTRQMGLHAGTPSPQINKAIALGVIGVHDLLGLDVNDPRTTAHGVFKIAVPTTNEDRAGNPLHAYLLLALLAYAAWKRPIAAREMIGYTIAVLASLIVISVLFKWQIFASRYHLGFFVLAAPVSGVLIEPLGKGRILPVTGVVLILAAIPWMVQIKSRPLIAGPGGTYVGSVLKEPLNRLYLANGKDLIDPYVEMTSRIKAQGCDLIGVNLSGNSAEYPIWAMLGAPQSGIEIHWTIGGTPSEKYFDESFAPCAVICESCPSDQTRYRGLEKNETFMGYQLFLGRAE